MKSLGNPLKTEDPYEIQGDPKELLRESLENPYEIKETWPG